MAEITLHISDELAQQLEPLHDRLPLLLAQLVGLNIPVAAPQLSAPTAYQEVLDFLITQPSPLAILQFKVSESAQTRLRLLLDRDRLESSEAAELDLYERLDQLMTLLKARAYTALHTTSAA
jgi:hypothetical protein